MEDRIHPLCAILPPLAQDEADALERSIREHGYDVTMPIVWYEGQVLDGRNRLGICRRLGIEPPRVDFEGTFEQAMALIVRYNIARRHLTAGQKALIADDIATYPHGGSRNGAGRPSKRPRKPEEIKGSRDPLKTQPVQPQGVATEQPSPLQTMETVAQQLRVGVPAIKRVRWIKEHGTKRDVEEVRRGKAPVTVIRDINRRANERNQSDVKHDAEADAAGRAMSADLRDALVSGRSRFTALVRQAQVLKKDLMALCEEKPLGRLMRGAEIEKDIGNVVNALRGAMPYTSCARCALAGTGWDETCKDCQGTGWINKPTWDGVPQSVRGKL